MDFYIFELNEILLVVFFFKKMSKIITVEFETIITIMPQTCHLLGTF